MAFKEDFDQFLETADFGEEMQWGSKVFNAIFDNATYQIDNGESQVPVDVQQPIAHAKDADVVGLEQGDRLIRLSNGVEYLVQTFAPDGTGMTNLGLSKA
jgi:hypothetical protein